MATTFAVRAPKIIENIAVVLAVTAWLAFCWFAGIVVERGFDWATGRHYGFESIGDFLRLARPHDKLLGWDRSFLVLGLAMAACVLVQMLRELATWVEKSPEQRKLESEQRRVAFERERQRKTDKIAAKRGKGKPMGGWRRLWIVLSIVIGLPTLLLVYAAQSSANAEVAWTGDNNVFWAQARNTPELKNCDWTTAKVTSSFEDSAWVTCQTTDPFLPALLWGLFPAVFMAAIGLTVRWIYRGFRPRPRDQASAPNGGG